MKKKHIMVRDNTRILEDVMEAFLCAIFLDQNENHTLLSKESNSIHIKSAGWLIVNMFIENLIEKCIDFEELLTNDENYKELLLKLYQKEFKVTPKYLELDIQGTSA